MSDLIDRQAAIDAAHKNYDGILDFRSDGKTVAQSFEDILTALPSAQPDGYIKIPNSGIDDLSDGYHTFRQLYYQRMMLFATIVRQNRDMAWKSLRHEDGELCFGGGWFIVGIDTPEGNYTYHYEDNFYSLFDCEELERGKHWDGHTEKDITRLLSLPSVKPVHSTDEWCLDCKEYDKEKHCCPRFNHVIRTALNDAKNCVRSDVVRCKNCKYYIPYDWMFDGLTRSSHIEDYEPDEIGCSVNDHNYPPDGFCSFAEAKDNG